MYLQLSLPSARKSWGEVLSEFDELDEHISSWLTCDLISMIPSALSLNMAAN